MPIREVENVLLLAPAELVSRVRAVLAATADHVWCSLAELPPEFRPDVVIVDAATDPALVATAPLRGAGVVVLGQSVSQGDASPRVADVVLPADFTDRELQIAVRLTARVARLRGELAAGADREATVRQIADTDPLTGLANRRAWERGLEDLVRDPKATTRWLALVDLDRFKLVNDTLGMAKADDVLRRAAQALAGQLRRDDRIARLGGDEFGVVLSQVNAADVQKVLERLASAVEAECAGAGDVPVTASIGYVQLQANTLDHVAGLLVAAELGMRVAKRLGGNRVVHGAPSAAS